MPRTSLDDEFAALRECAQLDDESAQVDCLRGYLDHRINLVVERATQLIRERRLTALVDALRNAFDRLLKKPEKSDPGCIGKTSICEALRALDYADVDFYQLHVSYTQIEPCFGGSEDRAGKLRAECALALVELRAPRFLETAVDLMFDPIPAARGGAVRAVAHSARPEAPLLLRMKALMGDESSEVMGEALGAIVQLGNDQLGFVGRFLNEADEGVVGEAAFALAESRRAEAVPLLVDRWKNASRGPLGGTLLMALAICQHEDALEALCTIAAGEPLGVARQAMEALQQSPHQQRVRKMLASKLAGCEELPRMKHFRLCFPDR